ncbi:MAG: ABC transporter ATP-binding protein [Anaerolineae bacterium]|nr:ABC transporter ATP-binding protein [Anaerolineae bacterium]
MKSALRLGSFLKPYWRWAVLGPLLMLLEVAMDLMQPRLLQRIVDEGVAQLNMPLVLQTGGWMIGLAIIGLIGGAGCGYFSTKAAQAFGADLREALFTKVQTLSVRNLDELETGQLITRLTSDVFQVQEAVNASLRMMVRTPLLLLGGLLMALITAPQLAFVPLALIPILLVAVILVVRRAMPLFTGVQQRLDALNEIMQENLAGIRVVKAFVRGDYEHRRFAAGNQRLADDTIRAARLVAGMMPVVMICVDFGIVAVIWFGGLRVVAGSMQVGQILAFVNYMFQTLLSLVMVSMMVINLARAAASAERVQQVFDSEPAVKDRPDARDPGALRGRVVFDSVSFGYEHAGQDQVLRDISFVAEPGQTVALLGATGSGKSSLVSLVPRFYDVTAGRITVDGMDVRDLSQDALRRAIGVAPQETVLFSGTIRDNIRYGRPDATDEEVVAAARMAQAHDFILSFPDGYDTELGQRGVNLSGGQKQRLAIARALLIQPSVLILDDSTSSVDVETEARIQEALQERDGVEQTRLLIAQRISSVLTADQILVLDEGHVVARGTHRELLATSPVYRDIYESQLGNGVIHE